MLILQGNLIIMINPHVSLSFLRANVKRERGQKSRDTIFTCVTWNDKMDSFPSHNFKTNTEVVFTTNLTENGGHSINLQFSEDSSANVLRVNSVSRV